MVDAMSVVQERLGLAAEHGYFLRHQASQDWQVQGGGHADLGWKDMVIPILEVMHCASVQARADMQCGHILFCTWVERHARTVRHTSVIEGDTSSCQQHTLGKPPW